MEDREEEIEIDTSQFHNEWYHHPLIEGIFLAIVHIMRFITHPYFMPFWVFALTYFVGGLNILVALIISFAVYALGYRVWIKADLDAAEKEKEETNSE